MSALLSSTRLTPAPHVHAREFDDELVVLDAKRGEYFALKGTGAVAWQRMADGGTMSDVADEIAKIYDVSVAVALNDLLRLGAEWERLGLVVRVS